MAGLYIHIPFCRKKCRYCDFVSFDNEFDYAAYTAALISEMKLYKPLVDGKRFSTIFIGGGTPSIMPAELLCRIIDIARECFSFDDEIEFTIEANPESLTEEKLLNYRSFGINRLSIGLQSSDCAVLGAIGRVHDLNGFISAFKTARKAGFDNINVDLMHGLPKQTMESYLNSIKTAAELHAEHISSYSLILEDHTPMYQDVEQGRIILPDADETAEMEDEGFTLLNKLGYQRYEISNFAKPGYECRHNLNYWDNGEYLGLGLNSHSALRLNGKWSRWANDAVLSVYVLKTANGMLPVETSEIIERDDEMFETIMVGLRKIEGISRASFTERFGIDPVVHYASAVSEATLEGNMIVTEDYMRLTRRGLDFQNEVLLKFM